MGSKEFEEVVENTLKHARNVLVIKAHEYVRNNDPFHNFNVGARITGQTRERVLHGFALKHQISLMDMRDDLERGVLPSEEKVNEKFGDMINYLIIEKASMLERINGEK